MRENTRKKREGTGATTRLDRANEERSEERGTKVYRSVEGRETCVQRRLEREGTISPRSNRDVGHGRRTKG